jgi:hypothetical protein
MHIKKLLKVVIIFILSNISIFDILFNIIIIVIINAII